MSEDMDRYVLPIQERAFVGYTAYDAKDPDSKYPPIRELRPPAGAPNIIVFLIDDAGFGSTSAFGGPCQTPNFERLANEGLRYTRFHTCALCSPTRAALLSGRNHHTVNMGNITELATSAPGQNTLRPKSCAAMPETLKLNGYSTAQFGKCHEVPVWQISSVGPFDNWPVPGGGFEYFYGFLGGETDQYYPQLIENTIPVEQPSLPEEGYTFNEDLADHAIRWIREQKVLAPDKPFFAYYAPGATHAPHHVPAEWSDKYRGKFDQGWDKLREETYARQKQLGVIPETAELTMRHEGIPAWDEVDEKMKPVLARQAEIYAGYMEQTDYHIGRVLDSLVDLGIYEETLIYLIIGDNGASAEGSLQGAFNEMVTLGGYTDIETPEFLLSKIDKFGTAEASNHYAVGWAHAMDTPYQWTKQIASHFGGTRNGTIVHWPARIEEKGGIRHQFHHVIDVAPSILEAAGLPEPMSVNGVQQRPYEGVSMLYSFNDAAAADRHTTQYFEMMGNRGIYHNGWTAVTRHRTPWITGAVELPAYDDDNWELYDTNTDWSQAHNIAGQHPDVLAKLQRQWIIEATKYNVLPLDDRFVERAVPELAGRPVLAQGNRFVYYPGMTRLPDTATANIRNKSFAVTAEVSAKDGADGVLIAQGGLIGGWALYVKEGRPKFCYNFFGVEYNFVESSEALPSGDHQVRAEFAYDGGGMGKGGDVTLFIDGKEVGKGRVARTTPFQFGLEGLDVGMETGSPVTDDYEINKTKFTGKVKWVEIDLGEEAEDEDHYLSAQQRFHIAMARQ